MKPKFDDDIAVYGFWGVFWILAVFLSVSTAMIRQAGLSCVRMDSWSMASAGLELNHTGGARSGGIGHRDPAVGEGGYPLLDLLPPSRLTTAHCPHTPPSLLLTMVQATPPTQCCDTLLHLL